MNPRYLFTPIKVIVTMLSSLIAVDDTDYTQVRKTTQV